VSLREEHFLHSLGGGVTWQDLLGVICACTNPLPHLPQSRNLPTETLIQANKDRGTSYSAILYVIAKPWKKPQNPSTGEWSKKKKISSL
jgi:hypothetical protein